MRLPSLNLKISSVLQTLVPLTVFASGFHTAHASEFQRPPQFVLFAFDGSKSLPMWEETREFARDMEKSGKPLRFTYFINASYYLADTNKKTYDAPQNGKGKSAIGFGGTTSDILARYNQTNLAYSEGHEIANHATGHYDGSKWSAEDWFSEFSQFYTLIFNIFAINKVSPTKSFPSGWAFSQNEVIGFRAPQLGHNKAMFTTLPTFDIKYDTSKTAAPNYWPEKNTQGVWNFPLGEILVAGTKKKTLSMDYNFYFMQSKGQPDPARAAAYEEQMYQSYVNYFQNNYNGNRAPVNIGHHFSKWNNGAYWRAMKRMAQAVCGLPEVRCVTYREFMNYMETVTAPTLAALKKGQFKKSPAIQLVSAEEESRLLIQTASLPETSIESYLIADPPEAHADEDLHQMPSKEVPGGLPHKYGPGEEFEI